MQIKISDKKAILILVIVYLVGILGFLVPQTRMLMSKLIWVNIVFSAVLLFSFHKSWSFDFSVALLSIGCIGFFIEVIGVKTGFIFGRYQYGSILGWSILDTPLIMGLTWITTTYISRQIAEKMVKSKWLIALTSASFMIGLDFFIEPFAIANKMWLWDIGYVPLHNYAGWFLCGFIIQLAFVNSVKLSKNKLALPLYIIQLLFFAITGLVL
ncbi:MAG: carotenoid biosynthesis protein [Bacteroidia bacterium]